MPIPLLAEAPVLIGAMVLGGLIGRRTKPRNQVQAKAAENLEERSTTSSAGGGVLAYETKKAVDEYLQFHFGAPNDLMPYPFGPRDALQFTVRLGLLCERFCTSLANFDGGSDNERSALDVGCAVGGASFELARSFDRVVGIDFSNHFVNAANMMRATGTAVYSCLEEGEIRVDRVASVPSDIDRDRTLFLQGDACNLDPALGTFDAVLAANLLCRLPEPMKFLERLPSLVKKGGVVVLVSPYSWLEAWTPKSKWVGGYLDKAGQPVKSKDVVKAFLSAHGFELVHEEDVPFMIREHVRKFQYGVSHASVWRKN